MRVIIAGSRVLENQDLVEIAVSESGFDIQTVLSGRARGIDSLAEQWAHARGVPVEGYPALWSMYGKRAGRIRNQQMAEKADALIAIMVRTGSVGTLDMIDRASAMGLKVHIHLVDV